MQKTQTSWLTGKAWIALPVILILILARCSSDNEHNAEQQQQSVSESANQASSANELATSDEPQTSKPKSFSANQIKAAMTAHIRKRTELGNPGVFEITDPRTSQNLELQFQKIHDPVRVIDGTFYFACTNFGDTHDPTKTYDLDFWMQELDGKLVVYDENVHKLPIRSNSDWVQQPRYNFVNDRIHLLR